MGCGNLLSGPNSNHQVETTVCKPSAHENDFDGRTRLQINLEIFLAFAKNQFPLSSFRICFRQEHVEHAHEPQQQATMMKTHAKFFHFRFGNPTETIQGFSVRL